MPSADGSDGAPRQLFVGDLLTLLARERNYDEQQVAEALGLPLGTVQILSGQLVSASEARAFCVAMDLDFNDLLDAVAW